jgi:hypothetical protein
MENKNIKLYKLRDDGSIGLKEVNRGMFKDSDSFSQALDFYYENGYCDSREEAKNSLFPNNSPGTFTNTSNKSSKNLKM